VLSKKRTSLAADAIAPASSNASWNKAQNTGVEKQQMGPEDGQRFSVPWVSFLLLAAIAVMIAALLVTNLNKIHKKII